MRIISNSSIKQLLLKYNIYKLNFIPQIMGNSHKLSNINNKPGESNSNIDSRKNNTDQDRKISQDSYSRIKQVLNSLYKNNFVSLSFVIIKFY